MRSLPIIIAALFVSAHASPQMPKPTAKWVLNYAPTHCTLHRERIGEQPGVAFQTRPAAIEHELLVFLKPTGGRLDRTKGTLTAGAVSGEERPVDVGQPKGLEHQLIQTTITPEELARSSNAGTLRLTLQDKPEVSIPLAGMTKALDALRTCEGDLAKRWGIALDWIVPPKPDVPLQSLFRDDDYPFDAVEAGKRGKVRVLLSIDETGRVNGCRTIDSSGHPELDSVTCQVFRKRATFSPALDAQSKPLRSAVVTPAVRFELGG